MLIADAFFYLFATVCVAAAFMVISARNPVHAVLFLILTFINAAGLFIMLGAEFLALILVVVYVGAVAVLFLFVVMMLDINLTAMREGFAKYLPIGALVAILMALSMGLVINAGEFGLVSDSIQRHSADYSNTAELGVTLYTHYLYPFEIAGAILLVAIIAAIALTMRGPRSSKAQKPGDQVAVKSTDRLRIVKMKVEKADEDSIEESEATTVIKELP